MIFIGDIALPFAGAISKIELPETLRNKNWFGNIEGAIIDNQDTLKSQVVVFNDKAAIKNLIKEFNFIGVGLANNHIFDAGSYSETTNFLNDNRIPFCGIGESLREAEKPLILKEQQQTIVILNFGWEVIQCDVTRGNYKGVNPLTKRHVLGVVEETIKNYPNAKIIPFLHWNYELEGEPQPFERELARKLIEMGVAGIIGCHPHRIGGFEIYHNKPIIYSLGNWMFKQDYYFNGKLRFPDFCNQELALEWDFNSNEIKFHFFNFDRDNSSLTYTHTEGIESETMTSNTPFRDLSNDQYKKWYKENHYHRNKGLPIYYWEDSELKVEIKNRINTARDMFVRLIQKLR